MSDEDFDAELQHRLDLASRPENMGEDLTGIDYALLLLATVALPAGLMWLGWYL